MTRSSTLSLAVAALAVGLAGAARAAEPARVGQPAPGFTLTDTDGKTVSLADFKGKTVVLEWFNPGCPFVKYAHEKGPLKDLGNTWSEKGVVWLAVNSSAEGKQGYGLELNKETRQKFALKYPVLLDPKGTTGGAYGARTTPHVFVIDPKGVLAYAGALDNAPLDEHDGPYVNYVEQALTALGAGKPVEPAETRSYGCSVKYAM